MSTAKPQEDVLRPSEPDSGDAQPVRGAGGRFSLLSIMDRYLILELLGPFLFGVAAFTAIMTATSVLFELITQMVRFGLPLSVVLEVLALRLPEMAFYTFPMSMLLASLLAFGRLSGESEITALKACGVSLFRIMAPVVVVSLMISGATVALNEFVVPHADWAAKNILYEAQHQRKMPTARENVFYQEMEDGRLKRFFYARNFDGQTMQGVLVQEFEGDRLDRIIRANHAQWKSGSWTFYDGEMYQTGDKGEYRFFVRFKEQIVALKESLLTLSQEHRTPTEMNIRELSRHINLLKESGQHGSAINELEVQLHQKLSVPFASVIFMMVGAPLGLRPNRSSSSIGLGLSILIIFVYYIIMFMFMAMGQAGHMAPWLSAWMPNLIGAAVGAGLIAQKARA
ncbi:putative permease YjgP/YjgQ family protein [compost metagenome]